MAKAICLWLCPALEVLKFAQEQLQKGHIPGRREAAEAAEGCILGLAVQRQLQGVGMGGITTSISRVEI